MTRKVEGFIFESVGMPYALRLTQLVSKGKLFVRVVVRLGEGTFPEADYHCPRGGTVTITIGKNENLDACVVGDDLRAMVEFYQGTESASFVPFHPAPDNPSMWVFTVMPPRSGVMA